jgi:acyl CoA:acetate/3-ketoacid CoA transferase beta subunit
VNSPRGEGVVDMLITDLATFEIDETGMTLTELATDVTLAEIAERTDARYKISRTLQGR